MNVTASHNTGDIRLPHKSVKVNGFSISKGPGWAGNSDIRGQDCCDIHSAKSLLPSLYPRMPHTRVCHCPPHQTPPCPRGKELHLVPVSAFTRTDPRHHSPYPPSKQLHE